MRAVDIERTVSELSLSVKVAGFIEDVVGVVVCLAWLVGAVWGYFWFAHL